MQVLTEKPKVETIVSLFNGVFEKTERTILVSGAKEPLYSPAQNKTDVHQIFSTNDYFSSALHEISHWCIAGSARRELEDYGYWYEPDGRTETQQLLFEKVEVKPQALEWIFTVATDQRFRLSIDNINQPNIQPSNAFIDNVCQQARTYLTKGLPSRAQLFLSALLKEFRTEAFQLDEHYFVRSSLN